MSLYLADNAPDRFVLQPGDVWIELHGTRGELHMNRLGRAEFAFRTTVAKGASLGSAAATALDVEDRFDAGQAMLGLFHEALVIGIEDPDRQGAA